MTHYRCPKCDADFDLGCECFCPRSRLNAFLEAWVWPVLVLAGLIAFAVLVWRGQ